MPDMHTVRLTKLSTKPNALRTPVIEGTALCMPVVGERFEMYGDALELPVGVRCVSTSPVSTYDGDVFTTRSGTVYKLEILPSKESA